MKKIISAIILFLLSFGDVYASMPVNPSYVSPTGSGSSCTIESPCSIIYAIANAGAGDTVNLRGGDYSITVSGYTGLFAPANSGSAGSRITFQAYNDEVPIITNASGYGWPTYRLAINFIGKSYITIKGLTFVDWDIWGYVRDQSHYNEFSYNEFYNTTSYYEAGGSSFGLFIYGSTTVAGRGSTHNWIHHNVFHDLSSPPCNEAGDIIRIGSYDTEDSDSDNNTVEDNVFYHAGHVLYDSFTHKNVVRNNVAYNDGFKEDIDHVTGTATGGGSTSMIDTSKNFGTACNGGSCVGKSVHNLSQTNAYGPYVATIASISTTTNTNDTVVFSAGSGTPTFASGNSYDISCRYFVDSDPPSNGMYGHRCFHTDTIVRDGAQNNYHLFEGNRIGHASPNPNNNGADGLSLSSDHCIVRYNAIFNNSGPGIYFKNNAGSSYNRVYSNTIFGNGRHSVTYGDPVSPVITAGIQVSSSSSTGNALKNNIIFGNTSQFQKQSATFETAGNLCESADDWCASTTSNPMFGNTTVSIPSDSGTNPDLRLQSGSPAINGGTYLTQANGSGSSSTTLIVDDALYFQDGTWGSSLAGHQADWIAVGTVANTVQISSIDYDTNTITLATAITWSDNDPVWLHKKSDGVQVLYGAGPDYGAYEYTGSDPVSTSTQTGVVFTGVSLR